MAVHYKRLPQSDPEAGERIKFDTVFDFEANNPTGRKFKSIFDFRNEYSTYSMAQDSEPIKEPSRFCRLSSACATIICYIGLLLTLPITGWFCFKTILQHEKLIIFRLGRLQSTKGPGLVVVLPCIERITKVDLRMKAFSVPPQKILTNDNAAIEAGAEVYYRIYDALLSVSGVQDLDASTRVLSQTTLQTHLTKQTLSQIETNKQLLAQLLTIDINKMTRTWGVEISRIEISQIKVVQGPTGCSGQAQNLLNMVTPALFPAGSNMPAVPVAQETSHSPAQLAGMPGMFSGMQAMSDAMSGMSNAMPGMPNAMPGMSNGMSNAMPGMSNGMPGMPNGMPGMPNGLPGMPNGMPSMPLLVPGLSHGPAVLDMADPSSPATDSQMINRTKFQVMLDTPQDLLNAVRSHLSPQLVQEFGLLYRFIITGNDGGSFYLDLREGSGSADEGEPPGGDLADVTLILTVKVLRRILKGDLSAFTAYMTGQMTIEGDLQGATDLTKLIDYIKQ